MDKEHNSVQKDLEQRPIVDPEPHYQPYLQYAPSYENEVTPVLTNSLVPVPEEGNKDAEQEEDAEQEGDV